MQQLTIRVAVTALLSASLATALAHGDDESMDMEMNMGVESYTAISPPQPSASASAYDTDSLSYFAYGQHSRTIIAHIALMILSWCFVLPAGRWKLIVRVSSKESD